MTRPTLIYLNYHELRQERVTIQLWLVQIVVTEVAMLLMIYTLEDRRNKLENTV